MRRGPSLILVLLFGIARGDDTPEGKRVAWYAIPRAAYDTDDGLGGGVQAEVAKLAPGREPYVWSATLGSFATLEGYQDHEARFDHTGERRVTMTVAWRAWKHDGYWGIGGDTSRVPDPSATEYDYSLTQPYGHAVLRSAFAEPWSIFGAVTGRWSHVDAFEGSTLEADAPYGMDGGLLLQAMTGVLVDTRDSEVHPRAGALLELSVRGSPALEGEASGFGGPFASARGFVPLGERFVLAGRAMSEHLWGPVPFYEMNAWGGFTPVMGFGGSETLRGLPYGRFRAPGKTVTNLELRSHVVTHPLFGRELAWEVAPFVDGGFVYGEGAGELRWHPTVGFGVRPVFDELFVFRIDGGVGWEPVEGQTAALTTGFYIVFGYAF